MDIRHETKDIADLVHLYEKKMLNLSPTFQRKSVWRDRDRHLLIESILRNFPIPAIFLYRRSENGRLHYDVIDGKQRLETIFRFMGAMRGSFSVKTPVTGVDGVQTINSSSLKRNRRHNERVQPMLQGYRVPVIEVNGELGDIIDLFVRINSTGKPLTPQEKRNAKYSGSDLLREATALAHKLESKFDALHIFSDAQKSRMKHIEFSAELIMSMHTGDVINKKAAVDRVMAAATIPKLQLKKGSAKAYSAVSRVARIFPKLPTTRFHQIVDFYSLAVLVGKLDVEGAVLIDKKRNALAWDLLRTFGNGVDRVREQQRKVEGASPGQELYRDYLITVSQMTDDVSQRRQRERILHGLLASVFSARDAQRGFTPEQRRVLWNSTADRHCQKCKVKLSWENFTIDHLDPHSRGGRSTLDNAALTCRPCNSSKGNRSR